MVSSCFGHIEGNDFGTFGHKQGKGFCTLASLPPRDSQVVHSSLLKNKVHTQHICTELFYNAYCPLCFSVACSKKSISSPYLCLDATYIVALLKEGFGFKENRRLTVSIGQNSLFYIIFLPLFTITTTLVKNCLTPRPLHNLPRSINCQLCHRNDLTVKTWENAVQELGKAKYWGMWICIPARGGGGGGLGMQQLFQSLHAIKHRLRLKTLQV